MKILVDADACPVREIIEKIAKKNSVELIYIVDTSHLLESDYAKVVTVSKAADAADFALVNMIEKGDIVVTQDYGVAAMALAKKAYPMHHTGKQFTDGNIEQKLFERHLAKKARRSGMRAGKHKKFTDEARNEFESRFGELVKSRADTESNEGRE